MFYSIGGEMIDCKICNSVRPRKIIRPYMFVTFWFKGWKLYCGNCNYLIVKFSILPRRKIKCPRCEKFNVPDFTEYP